MLHVGSHISSAKGYLAMGRNAVAIGANTLQFFLRNPRGGKAKALVPEDVKAYLEFARDNGIGQIMAHASYTLNPASEEERLQEFARNIISDDLDRLEHTPGNMYNIHPGSRKGQPEERAIANIAAILDATMTKSMSTTLLLETMSGKTNEIGATFEQLRRVIDACKFGKAIGVCLDTCHVFAAGYDIVGDLDGVLKEFDRIIGLDRLKAVHLNDSMFGLGEQKDRHAKLGEGKIGLKAFAAIINHPALHERLFLLETPNDLNGYAHEITQLKKLYKGSRGGGRGAG